MSKRHPLSFCRVILSIAKDLKTYALCIQILQFVLNDTKKVDVYCYTPTFLYLSTKY